MIKVVIDTNILLVSVSSRSPHHWLFQELINRKFILCVTTEILLEYEEIIGKEMNFPVADNVMRTLENLPNVQLFSRFFHWNLIKKDPDDNKFTDCAVASNATFLVSHDKHFKILEKIGFPKIKVITIEEFYIIVNKL